MATAGSGDVLSGVLAGIQCMYLAAEKKLSPVMLAALGVYVHGLAGDHGSRESGAKRNDSRRYHPFFAGNTENIRSVFEKSFPQIVTHILRKAFFRRIPVHH